MLDPKYIPLFLGGFVLWMIFIVAVGFFGSRGKRDGQKFLTGGSDMNLFLIFCTLGATIIGTGSSIGAIGDGFGHGWGGAIFGLGSALGLLCLTLFVPIRKKGFITMSQEAQYYYGGKPVVRQVMGVMMFLWSFVTAVIGMSAFAIMTHNGDTLASCDHAFSYMATHVLGPAVGLMFMICGMSATMSSGGSDAISGVTILLTDVYPSVTGKRIAEKDYAKYSRIALLVALAIAFVITIFVTDVIAYIQKVVGAFLPGVGVTMLMGRLWKRATWQGALATIFTGTAFGVAIVAVPPFADWIRALFGGAGDSGDDPLAFRGRVRLASDAARPDVRGRAHCSGSRGAG